MTQYQNRFSTRVENYIKFRPGYPNELIDILKADCGLTESALIADIGSGTGILSELFLRNGNPVFGVEPNEPMRAAGERLLNSFPEFISVDGSAEATGLDAKSVDFITAGQAFHWFDRSAAKIEFKRILKSGGWVVLVWNERLTDSTAFLRGYEKLLLQYGTDYQEIRHENAEKEIDGFFSPQSFQEKSLPNLQRFDLEGLKGRVFSSSYVPEPDHPNFGSMLSALEELFQAHNDRGEVAFEYLTKIYYGQLSA
jgi:SAM-dependent methyltransferase